MLIDEGLEYIFVMKQNSIFLTLEILCFSHLLQDTSHIEDGTLKG